MPRFLLQVSRASTELRRDGYPACNCPIVSFSVPARARVCNPALPPLAQGTATRFSRRGSPKTKLQTEQRRARTKRVAGTLATKFLPLPPNLIVNFLANPGRLREPVERAARGSSP